MYDIIETTKDTFAICEKETRVPIITGLNIDDAVAFLIALGQKPDFVTEGTV